jgi:hypothetical protein
VDAVRHIAAVSDRSVAVVPYIADILTVINNVAVSAAAAGACFSQWFTKIKIAGKNERGEMC